MKIQNDISVYLVEDDSLYTAALIQYLRKKLTSKVRIKAFSSGEKCLNEIMKKPERATDVVILDYHLDASSQHAMNGIDVLKQIKSWDPKIDVVMLSAANNAEIASDSLKYGASEYIVKREHAFPHTRHVLEKIINALTTRNAFVSYEKGNLIIALIMLFLIIISFLLYNYKV